MPTMPIKNTFRRVRSENPTTIHNQFLFDPRISLEAKGLLGVLRSTPDALDTSAVSSAALAELTTFGYIAAELVRDDSGQVIDTTYIVEVAS